VLERYQEIKTDLNERKKESRSLRRQFDSVTEYVDVLTEFLEKLRSKTVGYECAIYGRESQSSINAFIQTEYLDQKDSKDAWYFLEERLSAFSVYHVDRGYTISEGVYITRSLR
jgi:hypothetical protein